MRQRLIGLVVLVAALGWAASAAAQSGRWKGDGAGGCYWDPNDDGPNQCDPNATSGRWKVGHDGACYWEGSDAGPNQCEPGANVRVEAGTVLHQLAAEVGDLCDEQQRGANGSWGEDERYACGALGSGLASAASIMTGGTNIYADAAAAYCAAADIYYNFDQLWAWMTSFGDANLQQVQLNNAIVLFEHVVSGILAAFL